MAWTYLPLTTGDRVTVDALHEIWARLAWLWDLTNPNVGVKPDEPVAGERPTQAQLLSFQNALARVCGQGQNAWLIKEPQSNAIQTVERYLFADLIVAALGAGRTGFTRKPARLYGELVEGYCGYGDPLVIENLNELQACLDLLQWIAFFRDDDDPDTWIEDGTIVGAEKANWAAAWADAVAAFPPAFVENPGVPASCQGRGATPGANFQATIYAARSQSRHLIGSLQNADCIKLAAWTGAGGLPDPPGEEYYLGKIRGTVDGVPGSWNVGDIPQEDLEAGKLDYVSFIYATGAGYSVELFQPLQIWYDDIANYEPAEPVTSSAKGYDTTSHPVFVVKLQPAPYAP